MNTGIRQEIQDYLGNQTELLQLINGTYVRDENWETIQSNIKHLFPGDKEQAKLINPGSYIGSIVFDWISSYVGEPITDYDINWGEVIEGLLTTGEIRLLVNNINKTIESVKANVYYYENGIEYFITLLKEGEEKYMLLETFENKILEKKLYMLEDFNNLDNGREVPLDTLPQFKGTADKIKIDQERLVFTKKVEYSLLEKIKTVIASIEKKQSEIEKNFLQYTEQFKIFRNIEIPDNAYTTLSDGLKVIDWDKVGKIIEVNDLNGGQGGLEIVKNTNQLLVDMIKYIDDQIRQISAITSIPLFAFGIKQEGGNDSGTSKIKSAGLFYKKIEKYRAVITQILNKCFEELNDNKKKLVWGDITTTDPLDIVEVQEKMLNLGIQSKIRAIMKMHGVDREEAENILEEINLENNSENNENSGSKEESE